MPITYALIVISISSIILCLFPTLISRDGVTVSRKIIIGYTIAAITSLYLLSSTPLMLPLIVILSITLTVLFGLAVYFKVQDYLSKKNPFLDHQASHLNTINKESFKNLIGTLLELKGYRDFKINIKKDNEDIDALCSPISPKDKRTIAVKIIHSTAPISVGTIQSTIEVAEKYAANLKMIITNADFTNNAKFLAENNDCILVDNLLLINWVSEVSEKNPKTKVLSYLPVAIPYIIKEDNQTNSIDGEVLDQFVFESEIDNLILSNQISFIVDFEPPSNDISISASKAPIEAIEALPNSVDGEKQTLEIASNQDVVEDQKAKATSKDESNSSIPSINESTDANQQDKPKNEAPPTKANSEPQTTPESPQDDNKVDTEEVVVEVDDDEMPLDVVDDDFSVDDELDDPSSSIEDFEFPSFD